MLAPVNPRSGNGLTHRATNSAGTRPPETHPAQPIHSEAIVPLPQTNRGHGDSMGGHESSMDQPPEKIEALIQDLMQDWAHLAPIQSGIDLAAAHVRLAYGAGYTDGLEHRLAPPRD
jgi:hypothetical protein